jgi:hypothetical protein
MRTFSDNTVCVDMSLMDSDEWQWPRDPRGYICWQVISFHSQIIKMDFLPKISVLPPFLISDVSVYSYIAGQQFRNRSSPTWFLRRCHVTSLQSGKFTSCNKRGRTDQIRARIVRENIRSRNSRLDDRGSIPAEANLLFSTAFSLALGHTQPRIQLVTWDLSAEVKRPGRELTATYSAEVKNGGAILYSPTRLHGVVLN